jgi:hypothetical protein
MTAMRRPWTAATGPLHVQAVAVRELDHEIVDRAVALTRDRSIIPAAEIQPHLQAPGGRSRRSIDDARAMKPAID